MLVDSTCRDLKTKDKIYSFAFSFLQTIFFLSIAVGICIGQTNDPNSCPKGTAVIFGNGMFTNPIEAYQNRLKLERAMKSEGIGRLLEPHSGVIKYDVAYNGTEETYTQLKEVVRQKIGDDAVSQFWGWWLGNNVRPSWFDDLLIQAYGRNIEYLNDEDLQKQISMYEKYLADGYRVLIVSHSQGNLYANAAYRSLADKYSKNIGNVQVATPANQVASGGPWRTFYDDLVMQFVRRTTGALPANIGAIGIGLPPEGDPIGHNFIKAYLRNNTSRLQILADIAEVGSKLDYPCDGGLFIMAIVTGKITINASGKIVTAATLRGANFEIPAKCGTQVELTINYEPDGLSSSGFYSLLLTPKFASKPDGTLTCPPKILQAPAHCVLNGEIGPLNQNQCQIYDYSGTLVGIRNVISPPTAVTHKYIIKYQ